MDIVRGRGAGAGADDPGLRGLKVLVAEDETLIALDLEAALRGLGCAVLGPVPTVAAALALLAGARPDAALLDPGLRDGWAAPVADALAAAGVPFAVVTGYGSARLAAAEPALSAAPRLAKPYRHEDLRAMVARLAAAAQPPPPDDDTTEAATSASGRRRVQASPSGRHSNSARAPCW